MTYSRDWRSYPPAFINLIERAALSEVRIPCSSPQDAKRLEGKLHAFFGVLHRTAAKTPDMIPVDNLSRRVKVKAVGSELVAMPRDLEPDNKLILEALEQSPAIPETDAVPMSSEMRELFAKRLT